MNQESLLQRFAHIRTWKKEGFEAPHKALVLLMALAHVQRNARWLSFRAVDGPLKGLIEQFGQGTATGNPEEPFWRLKNDSGLFWEIRGNVPAARKGDSDAPTGQELLDWNAEAGFTDDVYEALRQNPRWVVDLAEAVYGAHPVGNSREEVFRAVGLKL
jgi:putative restriction endonuclease